MNHTENINALKFYLYIVTKENKKGLIGKRKIFCNE